MPDTSVATPIVESPVTTTLIDATGLHRNVSLEQLARKVDEGKFVWLDICGVGGDAEIDLLKKMGMDEARTGWALRFGQVGRLTISRAEVRAVTWLAPDLLQLVEIHVWSSPTGLVTVWAGDPHALETLRTAFSERAARLDGRPYQATAILLQMLLGTIDRAITGMDERLNGLQGVVKEMPGTVKLPDITRQLETLRGIWLKFDRYASAVRSALVGIEAIADISDVGVCEFNDYQENIEDVESRLHERFEWASDLVQDYTAALTREQGEQISRLTIFSVIFLPLTALTGFFGMNFGWMATALGGLPSFVILGVLLPTASVVATVVWLRRRDLL